MTGTRRRGAAVLLAMAMGGLLTGGLAIAAPAAVPTAWTGAPTAPPPPAPPAPPSPTPPAPPLVVLAIRDLPPPAPATTPPPATTAPATTTPRPTTAAPPTTPADEAAEPSADRPRTPPAPDPAPAPSGGVAQQVVAATNVERREAGCPPLAVDAALGAAAQGHASDMAEQGYFSHAGRDGRDFAARIRAAGGDSPGGENIAQGQPDAAAVVQAWMDSPGHRANILNCSFTEIGVGHDGRGDYWVQNFGR